MTTRRALLILLAGVALFAASLLLLGRALAGQAAAPPVVQAVDQ